MLDKEYVTLLASQYVLIGIYDYIDDKAKVSIKKVIDIINRKVGVYRIMHKVKDDNFIIEDLDIKKLIKMAIYKLRILKKDNLDLEDEISWLLIILNSKSINVIFENRGEMKR